MRHMMAAVLTGAALVMPLSLVAPSAVAQAAPPVDLKTVTEEQVLAACTAVDASTDGCRTVIAAYFAYLDATRVAGADLEGAIAALVVALAEADVSGEMQGMVVVAIQEIGTTYATGEQAAAILEIARTIEDGAPIETVAITGSQA